MQTEAMSTLQTTTPNATPGFSSEDDRYEAVRRRDPEAEGRFFYSVDTTGVYCRPTCAARLALRKNVRFHDTTEAAERAGFRPCKRCRPRDLPQADRHRQLIDGARASVESADGPIRLADLAARAGLSPHHFHRLFRKHAGMTPQQYAAACRLQRFGAAVREQPTVTAAIYQAGYSSSSRFYEVGSGALGMAPSALRRGGAGLQIAHRHPRDIAGAGADRRHRTGGVRHLLRRRRNQQLHDDLRARFPAGDRAAAGRRPRTAGRPGGEADRPAAPAAADIPLDLLGTAFQQRVWRALRDIPRGATTTYAELARAIGAPRAVRAVGTACGANPAAVAVPCHRVLRGDGALGGYRWGLERKRALPRARAIEK